LLLLVNLGMGLHMRRERGRGWGKAGGANSFGKTCERGLSKMCNDLCNVILAKAAVNR